MLVRTHANAPIDRCDTELAAHAPLGVVVEPWAPKARGGLHAADVNIYTLIHLSIKVNAWSEKGQIARVILQETEVPAAEILIIRGWLAISI